MSCKTRWTLTFRRKETGKFCNYKLCDVRVNVPLYLLMDKKNETRLRVGKYPEFQSLDRRQTDSINLKLISCLRNTNRHELYRTFGRSEIYRSGDDPCTDKSFVFGSLKKTATTTKKVVSIEHHIKIRMNRMWNPRAWRIFVNCRNFGRQPTRHKTSTWMESCTFRFGTLGCHDFLWDQRFKFIYGQNWKFHERYHNIAWDLIQSKTIS